jgi:hypothetical protein
MRKSSSTLTVYQHIADSLDEGVRADAIEKRSWYAFDLVPHDRLLTKIVATGVDLRVVIWVKEFLLWRSQRVRVNGQMSGIQSNLRSAARERTESYTVPRYVNDVWRNIESNVLLFADGCVIYRTIMDGSDIDKSQTDRNQLGEWGVEN